MLVVVGHDAVRGDERVAVAPFVIFVDDKALVLLVFLGEKLLGAEQVDQFVDLMGLLHGLLELLDVALLYAGEVDVLYLDLLVAVDIYIHYYRTGGRHIVLLHNVDGGVLVAFLLKVALDDDLSAVGDVGRYLAAHLEAEALLDVLLLRFFDAVIVDGGYLGARLEGDVEVDLLAHDGVGRDDHIAEYLLPPVALQDVGDVRARDGERLPILQFGDGAEHVVVVVGHAVHDKAAEDVGVLLCGVDNIRFYDYAVSRRSGPGRGGGEDGCQNEQEREEMFHLDMIPCDVGHMVMVCCHARPAPRSCRSGAAVPDKRQWRGGNRLRRSRASRQE